MAKTEFWVSIIAQKFVSRRFGMKAAMNKNENGIDKFYRGVVRL